MYVVHFISKQKIIDCSSLKAFADNKIFVTEKQNFNLEMVGNIVGNGENACHQHFLLFPYFFERLLL